MQNISNNPTTSLGPAATSESNNLPTRKQSGNAAAPGQQKGNCSVKDLHIGEHPLLVSGDNMGKAERSQADMDLMAKNRGTAMLRYKEKKKTRRCVVIDQSWLS